MWQDSSKSDLEALFGNKEELLAVLWQQFTRQFSKESDCILELYRLSATSNTKSCLKCKGNNVEIQHKNRVLKCLSCKKVTWLTAGTFFNRIRRARPWLAAIWLFGHGIAISASRFQKLVGVSYSTAFIIFKKLTTVIHNSMSKGYEALSSALFSDVFCKRSRETPARAHPAAEETEAISITKNHHSSAHASIESTKQQLFPQEEEEETTTISGSEIKTATSENNMTSLLSDAEQLVYDCLSDEPVHFDTICNRLNIHTGNIAAALTILELSDLVTELPGWRYIRKTCPTTPEPACISDPAIKTGVLHFLAFVRYYFQGVSRKYLQNYLGAYWCNQDNEHWKTDFLLKTCWESRPITYAEILEYTSPAMIKMML